jgi:group I intron endonuclease
MTNIIYAICDPITEDIRYIGKSVKGLARCNEHWYRRYEQKHAHFHFYRWLKTLAVKPVFKILETCETKEELSLRERIWIAVYKPSGRLTNMTDGGDGSVGRLHSAETRKRISRALEGRIYPRGWHLTEEVKENMSKKAFLRFQDPAEIAKQSACQKKRFENPEERKKNCDRLESYRKRKAIACSNGLIYNSIREAGRQLSIASPNIIAVLKGRYKQIMGLTFNYLENAA